MQKSKDSSAVKLPGKGPKVLLIDDSRFVRRLYTASFAAAGIPLECAENGTRGVQLALAARWDVIIVDGFLPDLDGREVCRRIAALPGPKPAIILYSASKRVYHERHDAAKEGVDLSLRKDVHGDLLLAHVERLLALRQLEG